MDPTLLWIVFGILVLGMLALDLAVFHRKAHAESIRTALGWSVFWIVLGLSFGGWVWFELGSKAATEYLAAYLLEKSLSVDNLFVISVIFTYFKVPSAYQHRTLFWGILGALVMRGLFIALGIEIIHRFEWMTWVLGLFLVYTAFKLLGPENEDQEPGNNFVMRAARKYLRFAEKGHEDRFTIVVDGKRLFTPLFFVLLVIETSDVVFAVDSIPAVLGITTDPYVVYTSNVFAILGLRALYFVLADVVLRFHYMKYGLSVILGFVGVKMLAAAYYEVPTWVSLVVIVCVLTLTIVASIVRDRRLGKEVANWKETHGGRAVDEPDSEGTAAAGAVDKSNVERLVLLHEVPIFSQVAMDVLRPLAAGTHMRAYKAGEVVFAEGGEGDALYIVVEGEVRIERRVGDAQGSIAVLDVLTPPQHFGEMSLLSSADRSASAVAVKDTVLLAVARDSFLEVGTTNPKILIEVIRALSERLRETDAELAIAKNRIAAAGGATPSEAAGA